MADFQAGLRPHLTLCHRSCDYSKKQQFQCFDGYVENATDKAFVYIELCLYSKILLLNKGKSSRVAFQFRRQPFVRIRICGTMQNPLVCPVNVQLTSRTAVDNP